MTLKIEGTDPMADFANSTPAPASHGPVTLAIHAVAAEHEPARLGSVVSLAAVRSRRPPLFTPIDFSFPLNDSLWGAAYLPAVRFAATFLPLRGAHAVEWIARVKGREPRVVRTTLNAIDATIGQLEEMAEALRIARGRLREADQHVERVATDQGGRAHQ